jgi:hypothetical protein
MACSVTTVVWSLSLQDVSNLNRPQSLESTKLLDYLKSKASITPKVTSIPVLTVRELYMYLY